MQGRCDKHLFEEAEDRCGSCGFEFCAECLVYAFGPKRPPFCIPCAVAAAGIRSSAGKSLPRREAKRLERERRQAFRKAERVAASMPAPQPFVPMVPESAAATTPDSMTSESMSESMMSDSVPESMLPDSMATDSMMGMAEPTPAGAD